MSDIVRIDDAELTTITTRAAAVLRTGGLVVAPAGPMYGVFADAASPIGTSRMFDVRGATRSIPLPVVIHNPRQLPIYVDEVSPEADRLVSAYWPGPLTLIFRRLATIDWELGEDQGTVALRMPAEPIALMMVNKVGPLACTAASRAGGPVPTTVEEARDQLGDGVALYLDDGERTATATTIVDVTRTGAHVLREGEVSARHVATVAAGELELGRRPVDEADEPGDVPDADPDPAEHAGTQDPPAT